ncbi:MAG: Stp1/IreP family PP2C-type Ser/Thr phosphatase [Gemmatimonadetes bacterium]|nr:Stp1/IreP family PP2C-type Ser/Thr phosphatase [Gemmatimonadota bacterium]
MPVRWIAAGSTNVGRLRPSNEDAFAVLDDEGICLVADGMGGHAAGEVASRIAVEEIIATLREVESAAQRRGRLAEAIRRANDRILAQANRDPRFRGMGTTATVLCLDPESGEYSVGHVGDSRAYRLCEGRLELLTRDHTWVQLQVDQGRLTPEEARHHPYSSILVQALGTNADVAPDVLHRRAEPGDRLVLCSDGLTATMDHAELKAILDALGEAAPETMVDELIRQANARGGPDNITVIVVHLSAAPGAEPEPASTP